MQQMTQVFIAVNLTGTGATGSIFYQTGDNTVIVLLNKDLLQLLVQVFTKSLHPRGATGPLVADKRYTHPDTDWNLDSHC
jgi:hypothetical protein